MKKIIIGSTIVAALLAGAGFLHWQSKPQMDETYKRNLGYTVTSTLFSKQRESLSKIRGWQIDIETLEGAPKEEWNATHTQPQVMFNYGPDSTIYTMNLDGTDVRLLLHRDEFGELPAGGNDIQRSPDGRYLAFRYYGYGAWANCAVYDLKKRETIVKAEFCTSATFTQDSKEFYFIDSDSRNPQRLELESRSRSDVFQSAIHVDKETFNPLRDGYAFFIDQVNDRFIYKVRKIDDADNRGPDQQLVFRFSDMSLLGKKEYLAPECLTRFTKGALQKYLSCNRREPYDLYSLEDPQKKIEKVPERYVLQRGKWYARANGNRVVRLKQPGEVGMFDGLSYNYALKTGEGEFDYDRLHRLSFFIPSNMYADFESMDLRPFMPAIPTKAQFDELVPKVTEKMRWDCARSRGEFRNCAQYYDMKALFKDMDQVREYMGVKKW
ncbi:TolB family protein [Vibrio campbellii]|uniref:Uncharacterized protein n=1 Tax=Vibrio campbellii TaxID=680 RepID=A0ABY5IKK7_9VIBR|nr:hypothetical protein [Vibrio campbellii]UTZ24994.1 hypothetical protein HB760_25470 [Vibrio campbellii]UTZ34599.1 hypothetical protein HB762_26010 [Vibrio campbellii]